MIDRAMVSHLLNSHVASLVNSRIRSGQADQRDDRPVIVVRLQGEEPGYTAAGGDGLSEGFLRIECEGTTYAEARLISDEIKTLFRAGLRGELGQDGSQITVRGVFVRDMRANPQGMKSGDQVGFPSISMDLDVWAKT